MGPASSSKLHTLYSAATACRTLEAALRPWVVGAAASAAVERAAVARSRARGQPAALRLLAPLAGRLGARLPGALQAGEPHDLRAAAERLAAESRGPAEADAGGFNGTVNLQVAELSKYAPTLGCARPSLKSLKMVNSESAAAAWEFKLRVEANPVPDYVLVTRQSILNAARNSIAPGADEDSVVDKLLALDAQSVVRARPTAYVTTRAPTYTRTSACASRRATRSTPATTCCSRATSRQTRVPPRDDTGALLPPSSSSSKRRPPPPPPTRARTAQVRRRPSPALSVRVVL